MLAALILVALNGYCEHKKSNLLVKSGKCKETSVFMLKHHWVYVLLYLFEMHYDATFLNHGVFFVMIHEVG